MEETTKPPFVCLMKSSPILLETTDLSSLSIEKLLVIFIWEARLNQKGQSLWKGYHGLEFFHQEE